MDVVALISGGKDSLFNVLHCIKNGHRIVALANLHPPNPGTTLSCLPIPEITLSLPEHDLEKPVALSTNIEKDELDSFMYQTIGHNLLPYFATALNVPLYRTPIVGCSVNQDLAYQLDEKDETEDLFRLLEYVKLQHANVSGVSSGAILSTYQRTRVESVCARLGLTSLSYLWQRPQHCLLDEMASVGLDARIVKVAAVGLTPDEFLWQNVTSLQMRRKLRTLKDRWGVHIAGEGGEYETIVIQGPGWRTKFVIDNKDGDAFKIINGESGVGHLKILKAGWGRIGDGNGEVQTNWVKNLRKPQLLNNYFWEILTAVKSSNLNAQNEIPHNLSKKKSNISHYKIPMTSRIIGNTITINNLSAPNNSQEMGDIMRVLSDHLAKYYPSATGQDVCNTNDPFAHITQITLLLRSMDDFGAVNASYNPYFSHPNPPSRVCVAIGDVMPEGCKILMHVQATLPSDRKGLHIQGRSYWAPANIGPYSQAIATDGLVYISGQIPLAPPTMQFPILQDLPSDYKGSMLDFKTVLALQHMWRIARAMKVSEYASVMAFTTSSIGAEALFQAWKQHTAIDSQKKGETENEDVEDQEDLIPNPRLWASGQDEDLVDETPYEGEAAKTIGECQSKASLQNNNIPPLLVVQVPELPRGAPVEWVSVGLDEEYTPRRFQSNDDGDEESENEDNRYESGKWRITNATISGIAGHTRTWYYRRVAYGCMIRFGLEVTSTQGAQIAHKILCFRNEEGLVPCVITVYMAADGEEDAVMGFYRRWQELCGQDGWRDLIQIVPVEKVWSGGVDVKVAVVARYMKA